MFCWSFFAVSLKINDYCLYGACLSKMVDLFFRFDGQNYATYLCYFLLFFVNFEETHPGTTELLKSSAISVARSFIPANRCAVDKTLKKHLCDLPNLKQARAGCQHFRSLE